jgi:hypothetical protein
VLAAAASPDDDEPADSPPAAETPPAPVPPAPPGKISASAKVTVPSATTRVGADAD